MFSDSNLNACVGELASVFGWIMVRSLYVVVVSL